MRWSAAYGYAKERSGAMKPSITTVEECMKNVLGSVYDKFHLVPEEIVRYADLNFDSSSSSTTAHPAPAAVAHRTAADAVKTVYAKYEPTAKELYERYEPVAEQCAAPAWRRLNQLSVFSRAVDRVLPKAESCMEKCNEVVVVAAERGNRISSYLLPPVPKEKIARVFG